MNRRTIDSRGRQYYCAGPIRGDSTFSKYMDVIVKVVRRYGEPYTERSETYNPLEQFGDETSKGAREKKEYERDIHWLRQSRAVIAEVSGASTGTGIEIQLA